MSNKTKQSRLAPEVRKHQIVAAGLTVARSQGYNGIRYSSIAKEVGISAPSVVHHYRTMPQLRRAVMRHAINKGDALVVAMGVQAGDRYAKQAPVDMQSEGASLLKQWEPVLCLDE